MRSFEGRVVVITGAGKGQGRSHALAFAQQGASLVLCDLGHQIPCASPMSTQEQLAETARMVESVGAQCITMLADTRSSADMDKLVGAAVERFGKVDVFVANAGLASFGPLRDMPYDVWRDVVDVNLTGVATSIRAVVPHMIERGSGRIIATSSSVAREGGPNNANYAASKWGVIGFVKSLAIELAPHNVTVNAFAPMSVSTDMCHNQLTYRLFRPDLAEPTTDDVRDVFAGLNPMGVPWLEVADASAAVLFLASDDARYVTGNAFDVAAGWNAFHVA
ncbi:mycofactocin-coupled SDR family oxidoreductase [Prescottella agglutinans]|uniref:3-oxoacyl-[acyl-carrier-protein] reductase MabA n=1 Tax=Prescottella agglutinans TaxID=1644129 RepID=A0ABT6M6F9_9NOCA|nr:mycofactocin-coupled SDR family oxidoreductase [Prescottella agglutinans]MDH6279850.1 SDR family mycofactocin-dependent oxidoreductase [Prescottella agglutinans]